MKIGDIVRNGSVSRFVRFREGEFIYETIGGRDAGFEFPVPLAEVDKGVTLNAEEKTILLMRWIRKHVEMKEKFGCKEETQ
jgi:hypothetical protein